MKQCRQSLVWNDIRWGRSTMQPATYSSVQSCKMNYEQIMQNMSDQIGIVRDKFFVHQIKACNFTYLQLKYAHSEFL